MSEANARFTIDKLLKEAGWILPGYGGAPNVDAETRNKGGSADYTLMDKSDYPLCVIEAKNDLLSPLEGKEQARKYAESLKCRFVILSNSVTHYLWDIEHGNPNIINTFPSQEQLELRKSKFNPPRQETEEIGIDYIARTQMADFEKQPDYIDEKKRDGFIQKNKLRLLRDYQLEAVKAVQNSITSGKDRFLLEMATGTGKTLTSSAIIKMFMRSYEVKRVLFLVDRLELETQAKKEFDEVLGESYQTVIWKKNRSDWKRANIVVSTVQSFIHQNKYRRVFKPDHFDLVISDEAHRSLGARSRKVFEYFIGFKLGLTATPKDYLKSVNVESLSESDPRQLERRLMLDTYTTFGCENGEPTFRYSLEDGVTDKHLINPKVIGAKTDISTELLSESGYVFQGVDEEGNDVEETVTQKDFEKRFFSANTNAVFCETFLKNAKRDPYTNEIGKTLVFCVSQKHAAKITQKLNILADKMFPNQYNSDFAVQVTSNIQDSQKMTVDFRNNTLNGQSKANEHYRIAKTRVCVTVGMMTTGYDCTDILNICMMRPIFSASEFIQMKGRGTRKHDFSQEWITPEEIPEHIISQKDSFFLFDFFETYDYFEKDFKYDKEIKLPSKPSEPVDEAPDTAHIGEMVSMEPDSLAELKETIISDKGMRVDRDLYRSFKKKIVEDQTVHGLVKEQNFDGAEIYLKDKVWDKPEEFFTIEKIRKSLGLDRKLTVEELLLYVFGYSQHIKLQKECLEDEFEKFDGEFELFKLDDSIYGSVREVFEAYSTDDDFRGIIDNETYVDLRVHPSGKAFRQLSKKLQKSIPAYIKQNVNLERLESVR